MTQTQNLRKYIDDECSEKDKTTLTDIISRFDMHQHAIPTLDVIIDALKGINSISVTREGNEVIFSNGNTKSNIEITESDLSEAYKRYIRHLT